MLRLQLMIKSILHVCRSYDCRADKHHMSVNEVVEVIHRLSEEG